jgi:predicted nucleic acid-binding protein
VPKYVFDTKLITSKNYDPQRLPETTCISSVVQYELMQTIQDRNERNAYGLAWDKMAEAGLTVVPSDEDCLEADRIQLALEQERLQAGANLPRLTAKRKREMGLDCLLAVTAARQGIIILALNRDDFDYLKPYCKNLQVQEYPDI